MSKLKLRTMYVKSRDESGAELVEFAFASLILFALMFGIIDFSRAIYSYQFATYAAQEGARFAIVRGAVWKTACSTSAPPNFTMKYGCTASQTDVQNFVKNLTLPGMDRSKVTATTVWPGATPNCSSGCAACTTAASKGCMVKVKVTYQFAFILPFLPRNALSFSGTSEKVIQQ